MKVCRLCLLTWFLTLYNVVAIEGARREVYKRIGEVELALYIFEPEGHRSEEKRPAALFFFGGGWSGGTPEQFAPHARYLASRGMVAIVADYRTAKEHKTTPFECVRDAKSAMRWVRAQADRLGIDPDKVAAGGGSAGGHLAAALATVKAFDDEAEDLSVSVIPNALLLFNPVYDNGPDGYGYKRVEDHWKEFSPLHNIREGMPPAIVFLGEKDALIPVKTAKSFQGKMREVGSRSELHLYEKMGHGFFNEKSSPRHYYLTVKAMDEFLVSLGYLGGAATVLPPKPERVPDEGETQK